MNDETFTYGMKHTGDIVTKALSKVLTASVGFYRRYISPLKKPACRFYPTCSQYAIDAVARYGPFKGSIMAVRRLSKCHPFHPGGFDPVR